MTKRVLVESLVSDTTSQTGDQPVSLMPVQLPEPWAGRHPTLIRIRSPSPRKTRPC